MHAHSHPARPAFSVLALVLAGALASCTAPAPPPSPEGGAGGLDRVLDGEGRRWVDETLASLTLTEAVGQLVFEWIPGSYASPTSPEFAQLERLVAEDRIGGVAISIGLPHSYAAKLNALQRRASIPLLVTSDFENGGPGMRINHSYALPSLLAQGGGTSFPSTMAFGAIGDEAMAYEYGRVTAVEARRVGVHLNFAPVLDVNSNPENPIISTRSFGEDPEAVARLGAAFIRGSRDGGVLTTAKHFPGHGDTRTDSHIEVPVVGADRARLDNVELVPFRRAVEEGVDAVMTAHVAIPEVLGAEAPPATLAPEVMTGILREDMGFQGLLFTDAMRMGAIANGFGVGESAVLALEAGSDVLLAPGSVAETIAAVVEAVRAGRMSRDRIDDSVRRILEFKARAGLHRSRTVDLVGLDAVVGSGAHLEVAREAAARSITLVRDGAELVPTLPDPALRILSLTLARPTDLVAGRAFDVALRPLFPGLESVRVDQGADRVTLDAAIQAAVEADRVLVSAYLPPRAGAGSVGVPPEFVELIREVALARPTVLLSFGSPYILSAVPEVASYLVAWGPQEVSQTAAAEALVGGVGISGRLPITLPPFHLRGEGLDRDAVPWVAELERGPRDELDETGMVVRRGEEPSGAGQTPALPTCDPASPPMAKAVNLRAGPVEVDPGSVGMDPSRLLVSDSIVAAGVRAGAYPGAALAVGRSGRLVRLRGLGWFDPGCSGGEVRPDAIWDLASLTKVVGTTTAVMLLVEEGSLSLDDRVVDHLPGWDAGDPRKARVTVEDLLLHRAGLPPFRRFFTELEGRAAYRRAFAGLSLDYDPGTRTVYSDIGLQTAAHVVEAVSGMRLDAFLRERVWGPLGMLDTDFNPPGSKLWRVAPTEVDTVYRHVHVRGVVHDENAFAQGGVAGHAGLFSTARDLSVFARLMLGGGSVPVCRFGRGTPMDGDCDAADAREVRILDPGTVERFTRRFDDSSSRALGWDTPSEGSSSGSLLSSRAYGHTGFTGTSIWIDPEQDMFIILLTNRVNPTRENPRLFPIRRELADAVARSVAGPGQGGRP